MLNMAVTQTDTQLCMNEDERGYEQLDNTVNVDLVLKTDADSDVEDED